MASHAATNFGVLLPTRWAVMAGNANPDPAPLLNLAQEAEALGYNSVWVGDSIVARPRLEALTTLAAVATRTSRVRLGTAIFLAPLRHPVLLANVIANLDLLSGGRITLGLGIGSKRPEVEEEFDNCGIPFRSRVGRLEEGINLMRRLWRGETVTFRGTYYQVANCTLGFRPLQKPGPPIWLAGGVETAYRRIARLADGWLPTSPSPDAFKQGWERISACASQERRSPTDLYPALYVTMVAHEDRAYAVREIEAYIQGYYGVSYEVMARRQGCFAGNAEECRAWLHRFTGMGSSGQDSSIRPQTIILRFASANPMEQMVRFAREIL